MRPRPHPHRATMTAPERAAAARRLGARQTPSLATPNSSNSSSSSVAGLATAGSVTATRIFCAMSSSLGSSLCAGAPFSRRGNMRVGEPNFPLGYLALLWSCKSTTCLRGGPIPLPAAHPVPPRRRYPQYIDDRMMHTMNADILAGEPFDPACIKWPPLQRERAMSSPCLW